MSRPEARFFAQEEPGADLTWLNLTWLKVQTLALRHPAASKEVAMKVRDVMTRSVISVGPNETIARAIRLMLQNRISGLPVIDTFDRLVGMVTEGDFLRRAETATARQRPHWLEFLVGPGRMADEYVHAHGRKVSDVMTVDPVSVTEDTALDEVVSLMEKRQIKRVPVVRRDQVVGIVSRANLLHAVAGLSATQAPTHVSDQNIREQLLAELGKERWAPVGALNVTVRDGIVDLWGTIADDRERRALVVAAENIPGIKKVRDHIAWIDAMSGLVLIPPDAVIELPRAV
jgi:CBS domain-containing protein